MKRGLDKGKHRDVSLGGREAEFEELRAKLREKSLRSLFESIQGLVELPDIVRIVRVYKTRGLRHIHSLL